MGCTTSHQEIITQSYKDLEYRHCQKNNNIQIKLPKGGIIVQTVIGNIQYGIPPESVKDSIITGVDVPEYYMIPKNRFNFEDGISLVEIEFPIYYNFFLK